jgi:hypothetical protein
MKQPRVTYDSVGIEVATFSDENLSVGSSTLYRHAVFLNSFSRSWLACDLKVSVNGRNV